VSTIPIRPIRPIADSLNMPRLESPPVNNNNTVTVVINGVPSRTRSMIGELHARAHEGPTAAVVNDVNSTGQPSMATRRSSEDQGQVFGEREPGAEPASASDLHSQGVEQTGSSLSGAAPRAATGGGTGAAATGGAASRGGSTGGGSSGASGGVRPIGATEAQQLRSRIAELENEVAFLHAALQQPAQPLGHQLMLDTQVLSTPYSGVCFHLDRACQGLRNANEVRVLRFCRVCARTIGLH
jgi:hypothetical protein